MPKPDRYEKTARRYFDATVTDRERAIFEGAITLGALYHQFVGTPVSDDRRVLRALETAISRTMGLQPYKEQVKVRIDRKQLKRKRVGRYFYEALKGKHLQATVTTRYGDARAVLKVRYVPALDFNLMYIHKIETAKKPRMKRS